MMTKNELLEFWKNACKSNLAFPADLAETAVNYLHEIGKTND